MVWNALIGLGVILGPLALLTALGYFLGPAYNRSWRYDEDVSNTGTRISVGLRGLAVTLFGTAVALIAFGFIFIVLADLGKAITGW